MCRITCSLLVIVFAAMQPSEAFATPRQIIILRHGEKQDPYRLCDIGVQRSLALAGQYLGKGARDSLFPRGRAPDGFIGITLHTLELISPTVQSWGKPVVMYSALPMHGEIHQQWSPMLSRRTQEAGRDVMTDAQWDDKTIVMVWEHHHIASRQLEHDVSGDKVTLRQILNLDALESVPHTWSGDNFNYFWIVDYGKDSDRPTRFRSRKQAFDPPFQKLPENDWGKPPSYPAGSKCEK